MRSGLLADLPARARPESGWFCCYGARESRQWGAASGRRLVDPTRPSKSRLSYDLFTTFFEYVDDYTGGVVQSGVLLESVRDHGVEAGIRRAVGADLAALEQGWKAYLLERYGGSLEGLSCGPGSG